MLPLYTTSISTHHDDVIKWKHFPCCRTFVWRIHRSLVNSPHRGPVMRSFGVFFDLRLNKRLSKQWWGWWFEMPPCPLWCHCNDHPAHCMLPRMASLQHLHAWFEFNPIGKRDNHNNTHSDLTYPPLLMHICCYATTNIQSFLGWWVCTLSLCRCHFKSLWNNSKDPKRHLSILHISFTEMQIMMLIIWCCWQHNLFIHPSLLPKDLLYIEAKYQGIIWINLYHTKSASSSDPFH